MNPSERKQKLMKKGKTTVIGTQEYAIEIVYSKEHGAGCSWCKLLVSRETGRTYNGVVELGESLSLIMTHYAYDIHNSVMYSHAKTISVFVWQVWGKSRSLVETHEITKGE
jgi:hypothetical protein